MTKQYIDIQLLCFLLLLLLFPVMLQGQPSTRVVTGTVLDHRGQEIPGVSIRLEGTTISTISGVDGTFSISFTADFSSPVLLFSHPRQATQRIDVAQASALRVTMLPSGHSYESRRRSKRLYATATLTALGTSAYFYYSSVNLADDYPGAMADATATYEKMERHEMIAMISLGAAVPLGVMTLVRSSQQRRLGGNVHITAMPVRDGALIGLSLKF